jgi:hypothetical protein
MKAIKSSGNFAVDVDSFEEEVRDASDEDSTITESSTQYPRKIGSRFNHRYLNVNVKGFFQNESERRENSHYQFLKKSFLCFII